MLSKKVRHGAHEIEVQCWGSSDRVLYDNEEVSWENGISGSDNTFEVEEDGQLVRYDVLTSHRRGDYWHAPECQVALIRDSILIHNDGVSVPSERLQIPTKQAQAENQENASSGRMVARPREEQSCSVCKLQINKGENLILCPHCGSPAHKIHLLEWLHTRGDCPICHQDINEEELTDQLPTSRKQ